MQPVIVARAAHATAWNLARRTHSLTPWPGHSGKTGARGSCPLVAVTGSTIRPAVWSSGSLAPLNSLAYDCPLPNVVPKRLPSCCSVGGLDSATVLALAMEAGYRCYAMSFRYGQRHEIESAAARRVADAAGVARHITVEIDLRQFGGVR